MNINKISEIDSLVESIRVELYDNTAIVYNLDLHIKRIFESLILLGFKNMSGEELNFKLFIYNQIKNFLQYQFKSACGFKENSIPNNKKADLDFKIYKLRLIYHKNASLEKSIERYKRELKKAWTIRILKTNEFHIESTNPIWRYKFLPRPSIYNLQNGFDEIIWTNEKNHICEGSFTNIFWIKDKQWYTPSLASNVLPGIMRSNLLAKYDVKEVDAKTGTLETADSIYLSNALIGLQPAKLY